MFTSKELLTCSPVLGQNTLRTLGFPLESQLSPVKHCAIKICKKVQKIDEFTSKELLIIYDVYDTVCLHFRYCYLFAPYFVIQIRMINWYQKLQEYSKLTEKSILIRQG